MGKIEAVIDKKLFKAASSSTSNLKKSPTLKIFKIYFYSHLSSLCLKTHVKSSPYSNFRLKFTELKIFTTKKVRNWNFSNFCLIVDVWCFWAAWNFFSKRLRIFGWFYTKNSINSMTLAEKFKINRKKDKKNLKKSHKSQHDFLPHHQKSSKIIFQFHTHKKIINYPKKSIKCWHFSDHNSPNMRFFLHRM
jgi:hypothetical protein